MPGCPKTRPQLEPGDPKWPPAHGYTWSMVRAADISRQKALVFAGALAAVFAAALIGVEASGAFAAPSRMALTLGSDATTGYMILFGPLVAIWGVSVHLRCPDKAIRRYLLAIAALIGLWMLLVLVKYSVRSYRLAAALWYCYYIPMCAIPTLCLACALRAAAVDGTRAGHVIRAVAAGVSACFVALVLTNNLHHLVFRFSFADPEWAGNYTYAPGYYALAAWCATLLAGFFGTLFLAARKQLRSAFVPLIVLLGAGAAYGALYALRHVGAFATNISLVYGTLALVSLELTLDLGLLPSYAWYQDAFASLPFDLKVIGGAGRVEAATNVAAPLDPAASAILAEHDARSADAGADGRAGAAAGAPAGDEPWAFRTSAIPGTLFKAYPVRGGRALLANDVSGIDQRRAALQAKSDRLSRSNALLSQMTKVRGEQARLRSERELYGQIEASLADKTARIKELLDALPADDDPASQARRREMLVEVKLLVAYCKRKGALVLAEKADPEFNRERLQLVFNETASDLRSIGVDCAAIVQTARPLPAGVVSVLYDCLYDFATAANAATDAVLMLFVQEDGDAVVLRAALTATVAAGEDLSQALAVLEGDLAARGIEHSCEVSGGEMSFVARIPVGREEEAAR